MSDLIDRQAAIDALDEIGSVDTEADRKYARDILLAIPSAERHGRWLRPRPVPQVWSLFMADCSECGKITYMGEYCMECGAKMERDE